MNIFSDYRECVFLFEERFSFSNEIIEDIIQDAFIKAYVYLQNDKLTKSTFSRAWICKVAFEYCPQTGLRRRDPKKLVN
jgi:DNA-directed RNA polymerase specialized sigma24 family protein